MTRILLAFSIALACAILAAEPETPAATASPPATADEWRAAAREDIEAAYAAFAARHPGMFDPNNPGFPSRLRRARDTALAFAERAQDAEGHMRALALFSAGLADGHAAAIAIYSGTRGTLWPGFTTVWRGEALLVLDPGESGLRRGSALLGCDGRAARAVIRELAFSFYGRPDEAGQWWLNAANLFDRPISNYDSLPRVCRFRRPDGRTIVHRLDWRTMPRAVERARFAAAPPPDPIGLTEPRPGLFRISLPSFAPDEEGRAAYAHLFRALETDSGRIAVGRAIVIDLRRNSGGSDAWSRDVAERLWGAGAVAAALADYFRHTRIRWLADPANIAYFRASAGGLREQGHGADADHIEEVADRLEAARRRGERFYVEDLGAQLAARPRPAPPRRLPPVYVIIDGNCASACLDALDLFARFRGVRLVGAPTSADSTYLEVRREPLPSGRGWLVIPTKIWVGRPRRSGAVYRPDLPVNDLEWTTAAMLDHVERDLAR